MPTKRVDEYSTATPADDDQLIGIDDSDTTDSPSGTVKRFLLSDIASYVGSGGGDSTTTAATASRPAASNDGNLFLPSDGYVIERDTGAAWVPWGPIYPLVAPPTTGWSWVNQGSSTVSTANGGICLTEPARGVGTNFRGYVRSAPSTPYIIDTVILNQIMARSYLGFGLMLRQSSDGKCVFFYQQFNSTPRIGVDNFDSPTAFNANSEGPVAFFAPFQHLRMADNGTNRSFAFSQDGQHWTTFQSISRTSFLTADQVGIFVSAENFATPNYDVSVTLLSWHEH